MSKERLIDLDAKQLALLHAILKHHIPNKTVWAYGSRVSWKAKETSDLDLAVFDCTPIEIYHLKEDLEESDLLISVDVMDWESIPESFKENIREKYVVVQEEAKRPEGWREVELQDLATLSKSIWKPDEESKELPYIGLEHIEEQKLRLNSIGNSSSVMSNKFRFESGNTLFGKLRPYFRKVVKPKFDGICSTDIWVVLPKQEVNGDYIFYLFSNQELIDVASASSEGTRMPRANWEFLSKTKWPLPPLPEQKAIAEVLSSLDDKIDLLHRQNKTLEAMAQALFRKWFVQGKNDTWQQGKLGEVFTVKGGTTPSTKEKNYWNGDINWTTPRDLSGHKAVFLLDTEKRITEQGLAKISSGLLPAGTVLVSSRAPVGYLAITDIDLAINQGYIAIICDKILSNYFVYLWCKHNIEIIKKSSGGTVFQEIPKSVFRQIDIAIPPKKLLSSFDQTVDPIFQKAKHNQYQIQKLENLRETLLPKLMNGEVKLIPAESIDSGII